MVISCASSRSVAAVMVVLPSRLTSTVRITMSNAAYARSTLKASRRSLPRMPVKSPARSITRLPTVTCCGVKLCVEALPCPTAVLQLIGAGAAAGEESGTTPEARLICTAMSLAWMCNPFGKPMNSASSSEEVVAT